MDRADNFFVPQSTRGYRLTIFTQLKQAIETMHEPEGLFQWLASIIMQRFDVPIVQLWSFENRLPGQSSTQLLATSSQNPAQPLHVINEKVAITVEQISGAQHISYPQPVELVFPSYVGSLLKRYGLSYCTYCVIDRNVSSPVNANSNSQPSIPAGFTCTALLFLRQNVDPDVISTINVVLDQAFVIAENHRLFSPAITNPNFFPPTQGSIAPGIPPALPDLVPRRKQDGGLMLSSNPFANPVAISDKQAQRLYEAIDSRKTVAELCRSIGMSLMEAQQSLQALLRSQQIEIYTLDGWPVDSALLFKNL
ncbi:MAG: hypothetical protein ACXWPG_16000 [Ktedonobacteraceae bacterium]